MSDFELSQQYDAVLCLFSSIAYLQTLDRVRRALACFRKRSRAGGAIIVEPWFAPGGLDPGRVTQQTAEANGIRLAESKGDRFRVSRSRRRREEKFERGARYFADPDILSRKRATKLRTPVGPVSICLRSVTRLASTPRGGVDASTVAGVAAD